MARRLVVVLIIVAAAAMTFTAGAEASKRKVLCGNFSGQGPSPHLARKPARCHVTPIGRHSEVVKLRSMKWTHWGEGITKGKGKVDGKKRTVRLKRARPCGQNGEFSVYSRMRIGGKKWRPILYCGD
jgi:hypothetical protein